MEERKTIGKLEESIRQNKMRRHFIRFKDRLQKYQRELFEKGVEIALEKGIEIRFVKENELRVLNKNIIYLAEDGKGKYNPLPIINLTKNNFSSLYCRYKKCGEICMMLASKIVDYPARA